MPRRKSLKVIVDIECHAVTCPGVFLPRREDVFINIEIFDQLKRTKMHPPVFPFLFHEKIRFEKVFPKATDPIQIAQELIGETVQIELVQLSYPTGDQLGVFVDNAREFLFPTPKVTPSYPGVDRELLFERSLHFPGIAPKLEFSSRTTIKEVTSSGRTHSEKANKERIQTCPEDCIRSKSNGRSDKLLQTSPIKARQVRRKALTNTKSPDRRGRKVQRSRSCNRGCTMYGYEQSTVASRARSPSPYARRRMAELSIRDPFESASKVKPYKTEIDKKPDFVVRKVEEGALSLDRTPPPPKSPGRNSTRSRSYGSPSYNSPSCPMNDYKLHLGNSTDDDSDIHTSMRPGSPTSGRPSSETRSPPCRDTRFSVNDLDDIPTSSFNRPTLQERLGSQPSPYEKIRDRVRALLQSPRATRIAENAKVEGEERYWQRRSCSPSPRSPRY